jgi:PAS domain S-box-containing protein
MKTQPSTAPHCRVCRRETTPEAVYCCYCGGRLEAQSHSRSRRHSAHIASHGAINAGLFRTLVDLVNDAIHVVDPETGRFLEVNRCACERLGYTREELLKLRVIDVQEVFPDEEAWKSHIEVVRDAGVMIVSGSHRRKDGTAFPTEANIAYAVVDQREYMVAVIRDVTERRRSEQQIRDSEARFRLIADAVQEVFWIADLEVSQTHYVSPAYERIWGRPGHELIENSHSFINSVHPDDRDAVRTFLTTRPRDVPFELEYRIVQPDGSVRWIHDRGFPTSQFATMYAGFVGAARDITERKLSEIQLRESEERYRTLFEAFDDAILILDATGAICSANPSMARMYQYSPDELLGMNISFLRALPASTPTWNWPNSPGKPPTLRFETFHRRKDGTTFPVDVTAARIPNVAEFRVLEFVRDLTEQYGSREREKILRDELSHAARLGTMGEMASGIAHELNQPLAALTLFAETARELAGKGDADKLRRVLTSIAEQSLRAGEIVRKMRTFVKRAPSSRAPADLNHLIREVLGLLEHELLHNRVRLELKLDERLPRVMADTIEIQQVVVNIVRNAVEAMAQQPLGTRVLTITTERAAADVQVSICDTGCGIDSAFTANLFQPFQTTKPNGMGIGLSICQTLIEAHGGSIGARPNPAGGTVFYFVLAAAND